MKKISKEEKEQILELHSKYKKKILSEQGQPVSDLSAKLNNIIKYGPVDNAKVVTMKTDNPNLKYAIKQQSKLDPTKFRYFFIDGRVGYIGADGTFTFKGKWKVPTDAEIASKLPNPKQDEIDRDIKDLLNSGIWFKREDLKNVGDDELKANWTQHDEHKNLYKHQGVGPSKTAGFTPDQQAFVDAWTRDPEVKDAIDRGIYKINPSAADLATGQWTVENSFIAPNSENMFPADSKGVKGLRVYFNNSKVSENLTRENCRAKIKQFSDAYKMSNSKPQSAQWINSNRAFVQQCADRFKFGGPLSNIDNDLNLLGGMIEGGAGQGSPWRINLKQKL